MDVVSEMESKAGFVIDELGMACFAVRAVCQDGRFGEIVAEARADESGVVPHHLERIADHCREALAAGEAWALRLVDVSAGEHRG